MKEINHFLCLKEIIQVVNTFLNRKSSHIFCLFCVPVVQLLYGVNVGDKMTKSGV